MPTKHPRDVSLNPKLMCMIVSDVFTRCNGAFDIEKNKENDNNLKGVWIGKTG